MRKKGTPKLNCKDILKEDLGGENFYSPNNLRERLRKKFKIIRLFHILPRI